MKVKIVFADFDGTLTHGSELRPIFFDILALLEAKQIPIVIVTGRSLSWGHFFLSHFSSLKTVIVEGGALKVERTDKGIQEEALVDQAELVRLEEVVNKLLQQFPDLSLSADSWGRKGDRAIELSDLKDPSVFRQITQFLSQHNINYSCSNVHLNFWCGELNKAKAALHYLQQAANISEAECLYFGDSLNDEEMFKTFKHTVGVSNIKSVLDKLKHKPSVILQGSDKEGPYGVYHYLKSIMS